MIVWEADAATGQYAFISPRAEQILGYPAERWLSDPAFWLSIVHPDDRQLARSRRLACLRESRPCELEYRAIAEGGRTVWFRETSRTVRAGDDRPEAIRGYMWDITRRKRVERQLFTDRIKLAERLADVSHLYALDGQLLAKTDLASTLEEVLVAVASLLGAEVGAIRLLDRSRNRLETVVSLGLSPGELEAFGAGPVGVGASGLAVGRGGPVIIEDIESDPAAGSWAEAMRSGGYKASFSVPLVSRAGGIIGAVATYFREPHRPSPRQVQMVEQYVLRAADAIDHARRHLAVSESDRRKEEFLATLAHELRSPLAAIRDWAELLQPGVNIQDTMHEAREVITRQAGIMSRLVDDLLDAARIWRGSIALRNERVDIAAMVARTAADLRPLFESRGQQLDVAVPEGPVWLQADPTRLGQVLTNLLSNAAKYTDPGGRIDLNLTRDHEAGEVVLRVRDTGIGLAPEALTQIFELFTQVVPAQTARAAAWGSASPWSRPWWNCTAGPCPPPAPARGAAASSSCGSRPRNARDVTRSLRSPAAAGRMPPEAGTPSIPDSGSFIESCRQNSRV